VNTLEKLAKALEVPIDDIMKAEKSINVSEDKYNECCYSNQADEFKSAEAAMQFILKQPAIMNFGGFNSEDLSDSDIIEFSNELLDQYKNLSYKYKFKNK